jgi:hypothetical protein
MRRPILYWAKFRYPSWSIATKLPGPGHWLWRWRGAATTLDRLWL